MKRILPIAIVVCLIALVFICLPKTSDNKQLPNSLEDADGQVVGVQTGLTYDELLLSYCPNTQVQYYNEATAMIQAVQQSKIFAYVTERESFLIQKYYNPNLAIIDEPIGRMESNFAVSNTPLGATVRKQVNEYLADIHEDGTYQKIYDYWLTNYNPDTCYSDKSGITGENGILMVAAEAGYEPFVYAVEGGELQGFSVDMIYEFCRRYGYEPMIDAMSYDAIPAALSSGKYTLAPDVVYDPERAEEIDFTDPFCEYDVVLAYDTGVYEKENFIDSVSDKFYKTFIKENRWEMFLQGALVTIFISAFSIIVGTLLGLLMYLWCAHGGKFERKFTEVFVWILESTPTVVTLMILYYVIFGKYVITNVAVSTIGFTLMFGCYFYDILSSGVQTVGIGQNEAARSLGFNADQTFFRFLLPQAAVYFSPNYKSAVITLIEETAVVGYIAVLDLTKMGDLVRSRTFDAFFPLVATALIYYIIIWIFMGVVKRIDFKIDTKNRKKENILKGIDTTSWDKEIS